jgi:hypothetical protein
MAILNAIVLNSYEKLRSLIGSTAVTTVVVTILLLRIQVEDF